MSSILIYRGIGGIGDALTATFPIKLFIEKNKTLFSPIDIAFPKFCHPVFDGVCDVKDSAVVRKEDYDNVIDIGDPCPAALYESKHKAKVAMSRAQLFAKGLGLDPELFRKALPLLFFSDKEKGHIHKLYDNYHGNVVGVTLHSSEGYRDYPHTTQLIKALCARPDIQHVFIFGTIIPKDLPYHYKVVPFVNIDLRKAFCAQCRCDTVITVDSLFLHTAGAMRKRILLIDGPLTSEHRFSSYEPIIINSKLDCMPCWRNGNIPCMFEPFEPEKSMCMGLVTVESIMEKYDTSIKKT